MIPYAIHCMLPHERWAVWTIFAMKRSLFCSATFSRSCPGCWVSDKSEMTLKQRQEGCRLFVCPLEKLGAKETQSSAGYVVCLTIAVRWLNKGKAIKEKAQQEKNECEVLTEVVILRACVLATSCYSLVPPGGSRTPIFCPVFHPRRKLLSIYNELLHLTKPY